MAGFNGKWTLKAVNNAAAFCDAIGSPADFKTKLLAMAEAVKTVHNAYVEEIFVDKTTNTARRTVYINGELKRDSGMIETGVELEHPSTDFRPCKMTVTVDSETKITRQEHGDGFSTVSVAELSGDAMTLTSTGNGESLTMTFQRL